MLRLIAFILASAIFLVFIAFNLENKCDVSLGFTTFSQLPVFLTAFSSFVLGMFFALLFVVSFGKRRKKPAPAGAAPGQESKKRRGKKDKNSRGTDLSGDGNAPETYGGDRTNPAQKSAVPFQDEIQNDRGPYGID